MLYTPAATHDIYAAFSTHPSGCLIVAATSLHNAAPCSQNFSLAFQALPKHPKYIPPAARARNSNRASSPLSTATAPASVTLSSSSSSSSSPCSHAMSPRHTQSTTLSLRQQLPYSYMQAKPADH